MWFNAERSDLQSKPDHFDFIEIGTSNYRTLTQACAGHPDGDEYAWNFLPLDKAPQNIKGMAIDMEQSYLDELPDLPHVLKVCAAVTESDGLQVMFHVPKNRILHWEQIFATCGNEQGWYTLQLAKACASLGQTRILHKNLNQLGLAGLLRRTPVQAHSLPSLLKQQCVGSIGTLKLDTEGHDCAILSGLLHACETHKTWYPDWIIYESNGLNDLLFGSGTEKQMLWALESAGIPRCTTWLPWVMRLSW